MSRPIELRNPLWFNTPKGAARAHFMIADVEQDIVWVCFLQDDGSCWSFSNQEIRIADNATIGRPAEKRKTIAEYLNEDRT